MISTILSAQTAPNTAWTKTIGGKDLDHDRYVQQTTDEGYIVVGNTYIYEQGEYNVYIGITISQKFSSGSKYWSKQYSNWLRGIKFETSSGEITLNKIININ